MPIPRQAMASSLSLGTTLSIEDKLTLVFHKHHSTEGQGQDAHPKANRPDFEWWDDAVVEDVPCGHHRVVHGVELEEHGCLFAKEVGRVDDGREIKECSEDGAG